MAKSKDAPPMNHEPFSVRFNLPSFVVFSISLIVASGGMVFFLLRASAGNQAVVSAPAISSAATNREDAPANVPPWGELITYDMELEHPEEYAASSFDTNRVPTWSFDGLPVAQVRTIMSQCGFTSEQVARAFAPGRFTESPSNTVIHPDADLIYSLPAVVRGNLYAGLADSPANEYMHFPACFPGNSFEPAMYGSKVDETVIKLVKPLLYKRGDATFFSDFEVVMQRVPTEAQRSALMKAFNRQPGVLVRVRIRPTTDIDKLIGYWTQTPHVRLTDLRPLLESIKRLPEGATLSLLYFLPPFARERLYTFPLPPQAGDAKMDCHWSTMNFFNENPDNRFCDATFVREHLAADYYQVQRPTTYGDVIVLVDDRGNGIHSAIYIADDIVFTKNGENYLQPWMLMRLNNLLAQYSMRGTPRVVAYRNKKS